MILLENFASKDNFLNCFKAC